MRTHTHSVGLRLHSVVLTLQRASAQVNNQKVEAELRKKLVLLEADAKEVHTNGTLYSAFTRVIHDLTLNYWRLYLSFAALSCWLSAYEQLAMLLPYVVAAPRLFDADPVRRFTLGKLVKVSNAFGKVFDSLNVVSDRWLAVTEWRSCLRRLREFEREVSSRSPAHPARLVPAGTELSCAAAEEVEPPWARDQL